MDKHDELIARWRTESAGVPEATALRALVVAATLAERARVVEIINECDLKMDCAYDSYYSDAYIAAINGQA